jgi:hypothetical protein
MSMAMPSEARRLTSVPPTAVVRAVTTAQRAMVRLTRRLAPPPFALFELVSSRWISDAIVAVTRLGVVEALEAGPKAVREIAYEVGANEQALYRVLRALARERIFEERANRVFALTALSRPLLKSAPDSVHNIVKMAGSAWTRSVWARLEDAIRTGGEVFTKVHGKDIWAYLAEHPDEGAVFHGAMSETSREAGPAIAALYDFSQFDTLVDVGGGAGELLAAILEKHPRLRGVLFDMKQPLARAAATFGRHGVGTRVETVEGNLLESVPTGKDAYILKSIVHGMADDAAGALLVRCRDAMRSGGKIFVVENVVPVGDGPYLQWLDLQMLLASPGGRERTRAEFESLFRGAGLRLEQVIATPGPMSLMVAASSDQSVR